MVYSKIWVPRFIFIVFSTLVYCNQLCFAQTEVASLHRTQNEDVAWQRTSPNAKNLDGPVLYALIFRNSATVGAIPKISPTFTLTNSLLSEGAGTVTINGNFQVSGAGNKFIGDGSGLTNLPVAGINGGTVTQVSVGTGLSAVPSPITNSGTISLNTGFTDGRYLQLSGGTMAGAITFAGGQTFPGVGTITGVTAGTGLTGGGSGGGVSVAIANAGVGTPQLAAGAVTSANIAAGQVVTSLNALVDNVFLAGGSNITITPSLQTLTIAGPTTLPPSGAAGGSLAGSYPNPTIAAGVVGNAQLAANAVQAGNIAAGQVVKSLNGISDVMNLVAGSNITITPSGQTLTIAASSGGGVSTFSGSNSTQIVLVTQNGTGIINPSPNNPPPTALLGQATATSNVVAGVTGTTVSPSGVGVIGVNLATTSGSPGGSGISGLTQALNGSAIDAEALATTGNASAVHGHSASTTGGTGGDFSGLVGISAAGTQNSAIFNGNVFINSGGLTMNGTLNSTGSANFNGNLTVAGSISAGVKDFKVDDPVAPAEKYLVHASIESSEMLNLYSGNVTLDGSGEATVQLPHWMEAENKDFRYQLTCIGGFAPVYIAEKIHGNRFTIAGGKPGMEVSWQIAGVRNDAYAKAHPMTVEEEKPTSERGTYLNPELFGAPESKQIGTAHKEVATPATQAVAQ